MTVAAVVSGTVAGLMTHPGECDHVHSLPASLCPISSDLLIWLHNRKAEGMEGGEGKDAEELQVM